MSDGTVRTATVGRQAALTPQERESFEAAIARHRRALWRVTAACAIAVFVLAMVVAILMAPLLYCAIGLAFDVVNLFRPAPDVLRTLGREVDRLTSGNPVPAADLVRGAIVAALPGMALILVAAAALRRVWRNSPLFGRGEIDGRAPDRATLAEERLVNVVEEMAIAAGIPVPRVVIVPGGINAAAIGRDQSHVTLLVGEALAAYVNREQLEGMIAHLIGSVVDGDMAIGLRVTTTLSLFFLTARVGTGLTDPGDTRRTLRLWRALLMPTKSGTLELLGALGEPFASERREEHQKNGATTRSSGSLTWREWLVMPLMGPIAISGFLAGMVTQFFLQPLIALAWRQRKYMADATAVQLTRDPDGLAGALAAIEGSPTSLAPWTAHLAVAADPRGRGGPFGLAIVPIFPSVQKRVKALDRMGAHVTLEARPRMPWPLLLIFGVLGAIFASLMGVVVFLLVIVSTMLSGLFTIMPAAVLHALLRWFGR